MVLALFRALSYPRGTCVVEIDSLPSTTPVALIIFAVPSLSFSTRIDVYL